MGMNLRGINGMNLGVKPRFYCYTCRRRCRTVHQSALICRSTSVSMVHTTEERSDAVNADMSSFFHGRIVTLFLCVARDDDDKRQVTSPWFEIMVGS